MVPSGLPRARRIRRCSRSFPVLTTTTAILVQMNAVAVSRKITGALFRVAPASVEDLLRFYMTERGARPLAVPIAAAILALWAASGVMMSLMEGFQAAYQREEQSGHPARTLDLDVAGAGLHRTRAGSFDADDLRRLDGDAHSAAGRVAGRRRDLGRRRETDLDVDPLRGVRECGGARGGAALHVRAGRGLEPENLARSHSWRRCSGC